MTPRAPGPGPDTEDPDETQVRVVAHLRRVAGLLERTQASAYRSAAFRTAAARLEQVKASDLARLVASGRLTDLSGVGERTAHEAMLAASDAPSPYLAELEATLPDHPAPVRELAARLRGDLHSHTDASDGTAPLQEMVLAALELGHEYLAVTDHSPRLTVAHGLDAARLRRQVDEVRRLDAAVAPFRVLTGIEVDILPDGSLDQDESLLAELDVVVASVHSELAMSAGAMTRRLLRAVSNPHVDVLGHCTGRTVAGGRRARGRGRAESTFDRAEVVAACAEHGTAVEVNSRPDRLDPPQDVLALVAEAGALVSVDSDAHAPGELGWQDNGCAMVLAAGIDPDRVVTTWDVDRLLGWTGRR